MLEEKVDAVLLIDNDYDPQITVGEAEKLKSIQKAFILGYLANKDNMQVEEWLKEEMIKSLPEYSQEEVSSMSEEIIVILSTQEEKKASLERALKNGRSQESWLENEVKKATSFMSTQEAVEYLQNLDNALETANESLYRTITTKSGGVSKNPNLDGFIAEQYEAQMFNLNAEATGSPYRAEVLEPNGKRFAKNSVDIVIRDTNDGGKIVRRYQAKYCKDAKATAKAFDDGNYRGQQKLVPEGQESEIEKKVVTVIEAPDGTTSKPLTKENAKRLQKEAQSGKWNELNWNEYALKDLARGIGAQARDAAVMGAAIGVGFDVAQKVWNGEEIEGEELVETALESGIDFGVKAALAGALKVGVEKGVVSLIPKGTPAGKIANIVHVSVENVKILGKVGTGELSLNEGLDKMGQTTVSTVAGIAASAVTAAKVGATVGTVFGLAGTAVGGFVGGTIGYMAGQKMAETVYKGVKNYGTKAAENVKKFIKNTGNVISNGYNKIKNGVQWLLGFA